MNKTINKWFFPLIKLSTPKYFYQLAARISPWVFLLAAAFMLYGFVDGLLFAPADYQQGNVYRIMYLHVPAAMLSLAGYAVMACCALCVLVWKMKLPDMLAKAIAPVGASLTLLTLITGSIWGKPMWGTWWIWDARLTSELILLFIYFGVISIRSAIIDEQISARVTAVITLIGLINIPIVHYSVYWWNTLHQRDTLFLFQQSTISPTMLHPLLACMGGMALLMLGIVLLSTRNEIAKREQEAKWLNETLT